MIRKRIGIIGCGAMGLYTLKCLVDSRVALEIDIVESDSQAGNGMPYREALNADYMLCNAFSREIPPLTRTLAQWLKTQPPSELSEWELRPGDIDARAFYPRVLIGEFLSAELDSLCTLAERAGHQVRVHTDTRVLDVKVEADTVMLELDSAGDRKSLVVDDLIMATGHEWPEQPSIDEAELLSPWPYTQITSQAPGQIGILGSSLSAVDIVIALGHAHGEFLENSDKVEWVAGKDSGALHVTMVSRSGVMPEGDFYYPFPYEPLSCITPEAVTEEVAAGRQKLLARVFQLLLNELDEAAPGYLQHLGDDARSIEGFASAYFKDREKRGGLDAVRVDLRKVRESMRRKETIASRYALLRGHEHVEIAIPHFNDADWDQFKEHLLPVFSDCYAALPHLSIARILAMQDAGVLSLIASGDDASFSTTASGEVKLEFDGQSLQFDCMFDARGQSSAPVSDLPFPSLTRLLDDNPAPILKPFRLALPVDSRARVYCLALPQVLERYPFSQGLPNCHELAKSVVADLLDGSPTQ